MTQIVSPRDRECERCGRRDEWDREANTWRIVVEGGEKLSGNPQCLHEWDINGTFNPLSE